MTGALLGAALAVGLLLLVASNRTPAPRAERRTRPVTDLLHAAGVEGVSPAQLAAVSGALGVLAGVLVLGTSGVPVLGVVFGLVAGWLPTALLRGRAQRRSVQRRELWPEAVDHLSSAVRAGLSLAEGLSQLGDRGPEPLRPPFRRFAADHRATGRFDDCLDRLADDLADPVGDRVVEALRLARQVGGTELGALLRTLSAFLREDARTRAELEARQSWGVAAARLALAAPWVLLLLLSTRPDAVAAYDRPAGAVLLAVGAAVSLAAYRLMLRIGRLPAEPRVLR